MANDWIKMRTDLYRDPRICIIADFLLDESGALSRHVSHAEMRDMTVTRNVTRNAAVGALVSIWGVMRHRGKRVGDDLVVSMASATVVDDIADLPGIGEALVVVGWMQETEGGLVFPRFFEEFNTEPDADLKAKNAERQRRFRENRNALRNVTDALQSNDREEKRREEKETSTSVVGVVGLEETSPIVVRESDRPELAEDFARIVSIVGVAKSPAQKAKDRELFFKAAVLSRHSLGRDWLEDALQSAGDKIRAGDINNKRALFFGICRQLATDRGKYFERELKRVQVPMWVNERKESPSDRETTTA